MSQELSEPDDRFRLRTHLKRHRATLATGFALGALLLALSVVQPFWAGGLVARVQNSQPVTWTLLVVVGLSVGSAVVSGLQQYVLGQLAENSVARWRYLFVESFLHLPLLGRQRRSGAWFGARLVTDPPLIGRFIGGVIVQSVTSILLAATSLIVLLTLDFVTVIVPVVFAALSLVVSLFGARSAGSRRLVIQQENGRMSEVMLRAVDSARLVIASNADSSIDTEIRNSVESARKQGIRLNLVHSLVGPATMTFMQVAYASVFVVGGWRVASHLMSFPTFITFLLMFGLFQSAIQQVSAIPLGFSESRAALSHLSEIEKPAKSDTPRVAGVTSRRGMSGAVRFDSVAFGYEAESADGLTDVSFTLPERTLSALIGSSGGGKSTCLGLMEGFFFADSGSVQILGRDMSASSAMSLRESLGYVDQESALVGNTVRSILLFGLASVRNDLDLQKVLMDVGLWKWVVSRGGLDSALDDRAIQISGGQRQLLAIARALLRQPELLLLDEPTSNLDGAAEARVRRVLRSIAVQTTVVITAHRLSTILEADWIVVLEAGRVVGEGSHETLMSTCTYYRDLVVSQSVAESRSSAKFEKPRDLRARGREQSLDESGILSGKSWDQ